MVIPFIFNFRTNRVKNPSYIDSLDTRWVFYYFLSMMKKTGGPIVAPENYFHHLPQWVAAAKGGETDAFWKEYEGYDIPKQEDLLAIEQTVMPQTLIDDCAREMGCHTNAFVHLFNHEWSPLVQWIQNTLLDFKSRYPVTAVISLDKIPSLDAAAEAVGLQHFHLEWGPMRPPVYYKTAFLEYQGLLDGTDMCEMRWNVFCEQVKETPVPLLDKNALLALFLRDDYLPCLNYLQHEPQYKIGVAAYAPLFYRLMGATFKNAQDVLYDVQEIFSNEEMLLRPYPGTAIVPEKYGPVIDHSPLGVQFINKCKKVASFSAAMSFEALLWGRQSLACISTPSQFIGSQQYGDEADIALTDAFLNFFLFAYLIPFQRGCDMNYLDWRASAPSETEIYLDNFYFYMKQMQLDSSTILMCDNKAKEILRQRGCTEQGMPLNVSFPGYSETIPTPDDRMFKLTLETEGGKKTRQIWVREDTFDFLIQVSTGGASRLIFHLPEGTIVKLEQVWCNEVPVDVVPENSENNGVSFFQGNPSFSVDIPREGACLRVAGTLQLLGLFGAACDELYYTRNKLWESENALEWYKSQHEALVAARQSLLEQLNNTEG